ncbi:Retrovirus-related Pol polyprotein from transposon TNT 1-94 [Gossypium australe]|uniref:Retrovirus-related Pol polyprotein from transposon TNT 1-94 n=1 Tax=Gossypium australe TaxID=47621 RepID=A0A5B6VKQ4_9ROSI|nr:Retrovirus-related Pol polyprotein from transposon TNT 1-94 [Gossypium australe]
MRQYFSYEAQPHVGLPRIPDVSGSNSSTGNKSHINLAQYRSPLQPMGPSSWYPDSGATHHTQGILLRGHTHSGLYQFSHVSRNGSCEYPSMHYIGIQSDSVSSKGPASVGCGNNWYYISFVDMFSRLTWLFLIQKKSQALECFLQFQKMVKTQFGKDIKQFQSDWGGEYPAFTSMLAQHGIVHRVSCPLTSEQNGVVEWKHRHIVEHKEYQCLTPDGKVVISRHVVFDEHQFLYPEQHPSTNTSSEHVSTYIPIMQPLSASTVISNGRPEDFSYDVVFSRNTPVGAATNLAHSTEDLHPHKGPSFSDTVRSSSATSTVAPTPPPLGNIHQMVMRSKAGIFKPKVSAVEIFEHEPRTINEAFAHEE